MVLLAEALFDRHLRAIGVIAVRWSALDRLLFDILRDRLHSSGDAEKLRTRSSGKARLNLFQSCVVGSGLPPDAKQPLLDAVSCLLGLYDDRNSIVHGQYGVIVDEDGNLSASWSDIGRRKAKDAPCRMEPAPVEVEHLMQHADAVYEACKPLGTFLYRHPGVRDT